MLRIIGNIAVSLLLVAVALVAAVFLLPRPLGYDTYVVLSGSMEPQYPVGGMIFVKPAEPKNIAPGDVISFSTVTGEVGVATHRVVSVDEDACVFYTKGDANDAADPDPVPFERLIGRAESVCVPLVGYISLFVRSKEGILAVCGFLIAVVLLFFLPEILKKDDKKGQETETPSLGEVVAQSGDASAVHK